MQIIPRFLRFFFYLLYHPLAFTYDLVAWIVSLGNWKDWVKSVVPFIEGNRILELGHGPGHLQRALLDRNLLSFGLDESRQMGNLAKKLLSHNGYTQLNLIRGLCQALPFAAETFDTIVATFPAEYIFAQQTLLDVRRTLTNGGRLIVLPVAWVTGEGMLDKFAAWLFRVTGQAPPEIGQTYARLTQPFLLAGFQVETKLVAAKSSRVLIIIARKANAAKTLAEIP